VTLDAEMPNGMTGWSATAPDWDAVYAEQLPRVYNYFRYRIGNDADVEDLTSRTFEKAWRARRRYRRDIAGFGTWLLRIARNVAIDHLRSIRAHEPLDEAAETQAEGTPEEDHSRQSDGTRLAALLADLPERERELLALKYGAGATNRAIAGVTGLSESNVGTILHRTVQTLRARWDERIPAMPTSIDRARD
jgi:RNA polymerase sigma-70 factor, ECF subfamily